MRRTGNLFDPRTDRGGKKHSGELVWATRWRERREFLKEEREAWAERRRSRPTFASAESVLLEAAAVKVVDGVGPDS